MLAAYARTQYEQMQVQTTPGRLTVMLYDGAIRFLSLAVEAMRQGNAPAQITNIDKAQDILSYLVSTLNLDAGPLASDLLAIYRYCVAQVLVGHAEDRPEPIEEVIRLLRALREGWDQAERIARSCGTGVQAAGGAY